MQNPSQPLIDLKKTRDFLICIDSDGCAFDSMEIKHKECFCPNTINEWDLQAVSKYAREAAEFVNLYSKYRGINRFPALLKVFELLEERKEVAGRNFKLPEYADLVKWTRNEKNLGNPALIRAVEETGNPTLTRALKWSNAVNDTVERFVRGVPPFPYVREALEKMQEYADVIVVSATPSEALDREWAEHDIEKYVKVIAGQEMGSKAHCIETAMKGRYEKNRVIMIGDAPGDMNAARKNDVLFYPINPGEEDKSWKRFLDEALEMFVNLKYEGGYESKLIAEFDEYLPELPPWKLK